VHDVNLIGEYNIAGEFWYVAPLFDELGLRILCTLSGDARFHEVQTMHRAQASMVVCAKALLNVARKLEAISACPSSRAASTASAIPRRPSATSPGCSATPISRRAPKR
jgi:nitrogenase molybdenum-iron protein alpha/beta subunit